MSDIFQQANEREAQRQANIRTQAAQIAQQQDFNQQLAQEFGVNLDIDTMAGISSRLSAGIIDKSGAEKIAASYYIQDQFKKHGVFLDQSAILGNIDTYKSLILGRDYELRPDKSFLQALGGKFAISWNSIKSGLLGNELAMAESMGDERRANLTRRQLDLINRQNERYNDYQDRPWWQDALLGTAESSAYMAFIVAGGFLGGVAGLGSLGAFAAGATVARGQAYNGLRAAGVEAPLANTLSMSAGAINGAIEMVLGNTLSALGTFGKSMIPNAAKNLTQKIAGMVSTKIGIAGTLLKFAVRSGLEATSEAIEEGAQEIVDIATVEIAKQLQEEGIVIEDRDYLKRIGEAVRMGFLSSLVFGVGDFALNSASTASDMQQVRLAAEITDSKEEFIKKTAESGIFQGLSDEGRKAAQERIYSSAEKKRTALQEARIQDIIETVDIDTGAEDEKSNSYIVEETDPETGESIGYFKSAYRTPEGKLYTEFGNEQEKDGVTTGIFKFGDASQETRRNRYGYIRYFDDGSTVTIDRFPVRVERESLRSDFFTDFAEQFAGRTIEWNPKGERGLRLKEQLIANNPNGPAQGLNYYTPDTIADTRTRQNVSAKIAEYMPRLSTDERATAVELLDIRASALDMSLFDYVDTYFTDEMFTQENAQAAAAQTAGQKIKGAVSFEQLAADTRALIYVTENSDFSTWVHENAHIFRRQMSGNLLAEAEKAFGVKNGKWTRKQEEAFAQGFEDYLREGRAPSEGLRNIFQKMADFLQKIYGMLKNRITISPEIREVYDQILGVTDSSNGTISKTETVQNKESPRDITRREERERATVEQPHAKTQAIINDPDSTLREKTHAAFNEAGEEWLYQTEDVSSPEAEYDEVVKNYKGTDQWMKAPNGEPTNLSERQWVQVRTPAFKNWFGDWEKAARIEAIEGIEAKSYTPQTVTKREAKTIFQQFEPVKKSFTTDFFESQDVNKQPRNVSKEANSVRNAVLNVSFPGKIVGKLRGFFNTKEQSIISDIRELFDTSIYAYSSNYVASKPRPDGSTHKEHSNIEAYHHFVNKADVNGTPYYIRFSVQELKSSGQLHAAHISNVEIKKSREDSRSLLGKHQGGTALPAYDYNLAEFFDSVKENVSKVVDENGEPLVVYHGTNDKFDVFNSSKSVGSHGEDDQLEGIYFSDSQEAAEWYSHFSTPEYVKPVFLNAKNPYMSKSIKDLKEEFQSNVQKGLSEKIAENGYDGILLDVGFYTLGARKLYLVFNPNQISATDNSGAFNPDDNSILFQTEEELIKDATSFDSWQSFMEFYETEWTRPKDAAIPENADAAWYESFWNNANNISSEESIAQEQIDEDRRISDGADPSAPVALDALWISRMRSEPERLDAFLKKIAEIMATKEWQPSNEAEQADVENLLYLKNRINRELRHGSWLSNAARVMQGKPITKRQRETLVTLMSRASRDYRALYAEIMNDSEWAVNLADTTSEQLKTRIASPEFRDIELLSPEQRRRIAADLDARDIAALVKDGSLKMDDPRLENYIKKLQDDRRESDRKLKELEADIESDNRHLSDYQVRELLRLFDEMQIARAKYENHSDKVSRMIERGLAITSKYQTERNQLKANYDTIFKQYSDLAKVMEISGFVKQAIAKREIRYEERSKNERMKAEARRINEIKKIRTQLVKRTMRRVNFKNIDYDNARKIIIIQRMFEPSLLKGVNKWIGTEGPYLRTVYSQWKTDNEFRKKIASQVSKRRYQTLGKIFEKSFDSLSKKDRETLYKILPAENWVNELNLEELAEDRAESIQLDIKENLNSAGEVVSVTLSEELEKLMEETLPYDVLARIRNRPFAEWTIEEMEQLGGIVDRLYTDGRKTLRAKQEDKKIENADYRNQIVQAIQHTGIEINDDDSEEVRQEKMKKIQRILGKFDYGSKGTLNAKAKRFSFLNRILHGYGDANVRRVARILDNGKDGINTSLLYWAENDAFNKKTRSIQSRTSAIERIMKEHNITVDELYQKIKIDHFWSGPEQDSILDTSQEFSFDELLFVFLSNRDENSKKAVAYGNFTRETERESVRNVTDEMLLSNFSDLGLTRYNKVLGEANRIFTGENAKFLSLAEAIARDYDAQYERMNEASIDEFNQPVWRVQHYIPLVRLDSSGETNMNRVREDLLGTAGGQNQTWVNKGMTQKRITISPQNQKPVELGLFSTWADSVERTEHFIAYAPLVRTLNATYKSRDAGGARQRIQNRYSEYMVKYIDDYINELANPNPNGQKSDLDVIARSLRGKTASAYLAWRASNVMKQLVTSPAPFFQYINPAEYAKASFDMMRDFKGLSDLIKLKSAFMASRVFDPMVDVIKEQQDKATNKAGYAISKFNNIGLKGLEMVDWACVAPGWLTVYRRELNRIDQEQERLYQEKMTEYQKPEYTDVLPTDEAKAAKAESEIMGKDEIEAEAVRIADDIVRLTQPSGRRVDLAPLFKANGPNSEIGKIFLQFQTSLNVIWQNIRYDVPWAIKNQQYQQVCGAVFGYMVAGIALGMMTEWFDDDDEEKDKAKKALYWSLTQFTDSVPIIGSQVSGLAEKMITGKGTFFNSNLFPVLSEFTYGIQQATTAAQKAGEGNDEAAKKAWAKAVVNISEGLGMTFGLPVSGAKELGRAAGIGDGDSKLSFNPGVFFGRK